MNRCSLTLLLLSTLGAGCGRTQSGRTPTSMDARPGIAPPTSVDGPAVADSAPPYPLVDDDQGGKAIDPDYAWHNFNELLQGTWLMGWYGGENHFSWIRFAPAGEGLFNNPTQVLSKVTIPSTQPYWSCSGAGTSSPTARPMTLDLAMPAGCARELLLFDTFRPVTNPGGALLEAAITACRRPPCDDSNQTKIVGLKYPDSTCDTAFTTCESPL